MPQLTLVALYGTKKRECSDYIARCQQTAAAALGEAFSPYDIAQVHATIVGLEFEAASAAENLAYSLLRGRRVAMDIRGYLGFLRASCELPFEVQIGGFDESERPFLSRNATPYQRSFSVQDDKAVVIGWPRLVVSDGRPVDYPMTLDRLRRSAREFGILHTYHRAETDLDNDLFFRIGLVDRSVVSDDAVRELERQTRRLMSKQAPLHLELGIDDLFVAAYEDERLPLESTEIWPVADPATDERLAHL